MLVHPAAEIVAVMGKQVDDNDFSAGFEDARGLGEGGSGLEDVGQGQHDQGGVAGAIVDGKGSQFPAAEVDVWEIHQASAGGFEHGAGVIDADDALNEWGNFGGDMAGSAAEVGDDERIGQQAKAGGDGELAAVELTAKAVPFCGGSGEEGLAVGAILEEALKTEVVLHDRGPAFGLLAGDEPQSAGGGIEFIKQGPIKVGCSLFAAADPSEVAEDFQMPADSGLGKLQDIAQFGDAEFLAFEETKDAEAGGIGEGSEPAEDLFGFLVYLSFHPYIRIKRYIV